MPALDANRGGSRKAVKRATRRKPVTTGSRGSGAAPHGYGQGGRTSRPSPRPRPTPPKQVQGRRAAYGVKVKSGKAPTIGGVDLAKKGRERNIRKALTIANATGSNRRAKLALLQAMRTESKYENLRRGDRDSEGVLQVRTGMHGEKWARELPRSVWKFLESGYTGKGGANKLAKKGLKPHEIAQAVQGSGPAVYGNFSKEARQVLRRYDPVARRASQYRKGSL